MPKLKPIFLIIFSLIITGSIAQQFEDELKGALESKPKFEFKLDSRHSFINQTGVRVFGVKAGLEYDNKLSFGIGFNTLWSDLYRRRSYEGFELRTKLAYYHFSPYVDYIFYRDSQWELSIPVQFGFGESFYRNETNLGPKDFDRKFVCSYEPAITFQYRVLKYFGAGMGIGYRLMIVPNSDIEEQFTSPVYIFKFKVYFEDLYKDFAP